MVHLAHLLEPYIHYPKGPVEIPGYLAGFLSKTR